MVEGPRRSACRASPGPYPSQPWSAEALAREVALSRSAFVDRFTTLVGMPPIRYLTVWRLQTAKLNLRETRTTIAQLAHSVGYESEEAFSRAFKREFGRTAARTLESSAVNGLKRLWTLKQRRRA